MKPKQKVFTNWYAAVRYGELMPWTARPTQKEAIAAHDTHIGWAKWSYANSPRDKVYLVRVKISVLK